MKRIGVVILNFNGHRDTSECLNSLLKIRKEKETKIAIYVVDNDSCSDSVTKLKKYISTIKKQRLPIQLIQNKKNLGFSGGNNIGIKKALKEDCNYVLLLNNDTLVDPDFLGGLVEVFEEIKNVGIVGPKIYFEKGYEFHKDRYSAKEQGNVLWYAGGSIDWKNVYATHRGVNEVDIGQYNAKSETDFISGCAMMIKREVIDDIGFLDERYFMYLEDLDYCIRAKNAKYKLIYNPKAIIFHKNASSTGKPGSDLHVYYQTRNRLLFGMKHAPLRSKLALFKQSIALLRKRGVQKQAVLDYYCRRFGKRKP